MANTLTSVIDKLLAQGLLALRENAIMPQLVNRGYEPMAGRFGSTIDVPIPSAVTAVVVAPSNVPPSNTDSAPTSVSIPLDQWFEAPFYLTDKELMEVMEGTIPMQASEAVKALANNVDVFIMDLYKDVFGFDGVAGTTPFASNTSEATGVRKVLNNQLAPLDTRRLVIDADAEANALNLRAFQDMSFSGDARGIIEGDINRKIGFDWFLDQNVRTHTAGTQTGHLTNGVPALGAKAIVVDTGSNTFVVGDIITFAGDTQTYVLTAAHGGGAGTINIEPGLKVLVGDGAAITTKATHVANLAFHRDAFAFATRPLESVVPGLGSIVQSASDPISGLTLRLEVSRQHKQTRYSYDILYGAATVRADLAARMAG